MIASPKRQLMTAEEYLKWESRQEIRHEYCDGEVFAMSGGTKGHDKIAFNLRRVLSDCVDKMQCEMSGSDVKVMVKQGRFYRYPDLSVSCDERDRMNETYYEFPKLVVEVLSPSTEVVDRNEKFQEYIEIPTLQEYILISPDKMQVECFRRGEGRMWMYFPYRTGETVRVESMGVNLPIEQLYQNVRFDQGKQLVP